VAGGSASLLVEVAHELEDEDGPAGLGGFPGGLLESLLPDHAAVVTLPGLGSAAGSAAADECRDEEWEHVDHLRMK
jgi:hypothetical protein